MDALRAEHDPCTFNGTARVMYGTPEHHAIKSFTATAACDTGPFDDPAPGVEKRCWVEARAALKLASPAPSTFKAPPGPATTLPLDCTALPASEPAPAQGDAVEADTPGSDGTRMFASVAGTDRVHHPRARSRHPRSAGSRRLDTVRASGRLPVAAGALTHALSCKSQAAGYFGISARLEAAGKELMPRGTRPAGIATFGVLPDMSAALPAVRFRYSRPAPLRRTGHGLSRARPALLRRRRLSPGLYRRSACPGPTTIATGIWRSRRKRGTFDPATKQLTPFFRRGDIMRLIQLDGIPQWASPTGKETHSYAPTSLAQMKDYMAKVGAESNRVRTTYFPKQRDNYYQVTWEPDADGGLPWRDTDANFVAMYKAVWEGIHQTDPHAVVMGLTYSSVQGNVTWMRRLGPLGIGRYMDGMTFTATTISARRRRIRPSASPTPAIRAPCRARCPPRCARCATKCVCT